MDPEPNLVVLQAANDLTSDSGASVRYASSGT